MLQPVMHNSVCWYIAIVQMIHYPYIDFTDSLLLNCVTSNWEEWMGLSDDDVIKKFLSSPNMY